MSGNVPTETLLLASVSALEPEVLRIFFLELENLEARSPEKLYHAFVWELLFADWFSDAWDGALRLKFGPTWRSALQVFEPPACQFLDRQHRKWRCEATRRHRERRRLVQRAKAAGKHST